MNLNPDRPMLGPKPEDCPCADENCGKFGVLQRRTGHVRGCACRPCLGGRNRRKGMNAQRAARKRMGIPTTKFVGAMGNEENWRGYFRVEVKSGKTQNPVLNSYLKVKSQSDQHKADGDARPFAGIFTDDLGRFGVVAVSLADWEAHIAPRLEETA